MKNYLLGIVTVIILVIAGFIVYQYGKQNATKEIAPVVPATTQSPSKLTPTVLPTPTVSKENDSALIKKALFSKNNWADDGSLTFTVSTNDGKYASGGVSAQGGGGYFFAAKVNGQWEIVADGNGTISCSSMAKYPDFPKTLIPECYNDQTQKIIKR